MQAMTEKVLEKSNYRLDWVLEDENGDAITPTALTWTLTDLSGNVINSRSAVVVTPLASSFSVFLTNADLALATAPEKPWLPYFEQRLVTIQATYLDGGVTGYIKDSAKFSVCNEAAVS
jgi:hypothetical protein